jgi:peptidyl-prolyl cis-trans isomerase D
MLRGIHKASSTWLGKGVLAVIMGFLVISFAIWGIGDIFRGFGRNAAITVGGTEISLENLREYYTDQLRQVSRRFGRAITPDQARALGLDRQIIGRLVAETTLDEQAKALGLGIANAEIAKRITSDPNFRGPNGQFDRMRFEQLIRDAGYNEARFIDTQRKVILRRQIAQSFAGELKVPQTAVQALNQFRNEKRNIEYLELGEAQAGDIPAPGADQLSKYFDEHKVLFRAPEFRKVALLALSPAALAKPGNVSDADAKTYFDQHKDEFGTPEKRDVKQIIFPNTEEAKAARERIEKGESFADIAKQRQLKTSDTDLGMVTKKQIIAAAIADAAFSLKAGDVSQPVEGAFGTVLLTVGKIEPGTQKTFDDVKQQIKQKIAESRARTQIGDLRDKIEDERAAGSTLVETGKKLGISVRVIDAVDRSGRDPEGNPISDLQPNVVTAAFGSDVGADTEALQLPGGGYLYYGVLGITPSRERTLDEEKDKVTQRWHSDEVAKRLAAKAAEMVSKIKGGATLATIASENGLQVQTSSGLQRGKPSGFLPAQVIAAAFKIPKNSVVSAEGKQTGERFVLRVTEVVDPTLDAGSSEDKALVGTLQNSYADDISGEYIAHLESELGVDINQLLVRQVIGGANQ